MIYLKVHLLFTHEPSFPSSFLSAPCPYVATDDGVVSPSFSDLCLLLFSPIAPFFLCSPWFCSCFFTLPALLGSMCPLSVFRCFLRSVCLTSLQCSFLSFLLLSCSPCCILLSYFSYSISKATIFSVCKVMPQRYLPGIYGSLRSDQWRSN